MNADIDKNRGDYVSPILAEAGNTISVFPSYGFDNSALIEALCQSDASDSHAGRPMEILSTIPDLEAYLAGDESGLVIVLYARPEEALASALVGGTPPERAVKECELQVRTLLETVRRDRKRFILIEQTSAEAHPDLLAGMLEQRLGRPFPALASLSLAKRQRVSGLYRALAALSLQEHASLRRHHAELQASTMPLAPAQENQLLWEAAFDELTALQAEMRDGHRTAHLTEENEMLRQQLAGLQRDFETVAKNEVAATKRNIALLQQVARLEADGPAVTAVRPDVVGTPRDETFRLEAELRAAIRREQKASASLDAVHASTSWRVTRPLRMLKLRLGRFTGGKRS